MNRAAVSVVMHLMVASVLLPAIGCGEEGEKGPWRKGYVASCRSLGDEPWRLEYCECMGNQVVDQLNWKQLDAADVKLLRIMNDRYSSTCLPRDLLNQQWKKNFIASCSAKNGEAWAPAFCGCIADKAVTELSREQLADPDAVTRLAEQSAVACMPKDVVDKQWKESFVESCVDVGEKKTYCECAAEKATSAWTSEQLTDPDYTSAHIQEVSQDCEK